MPLHHYHSLPTPTVETLRKVEILSKTAESEAMLDPPKFQPSDLRQYFQVMLSDLATQLPENEWVKQQVEEIKVGKQRMSPGELIKIHVGCSQIAERLRQTVSLEKAAKKESSSNADEEEAALEA